MLTRLVKLPANSGFSAVPDAIKLLTPPAPPEEVNLEEQDPGGVTCKEGFGIGQRARTSGEMMEDRVIIARMLVTRRPKGEIAAYINSIRPYKYYPAKLHYDIAAIEAEYKQVMQSRLYALKAKELQAIEEQERVAWDAWEKSCKPLKTKTETFMKDGKDADSDVKKFTKGIGQTKTVERVGDPRFMMVLIKLREQRIAILGLNEPTKLEVTTGRLNLPKMRDAYRQRLLAEQNLESQLAASRGVSQTVNI